MKYRLAPAGDLIKKELNIEWEKYFDQLFHSMFYRFYDSGTSALASAVLAAKKIKKVKYPEVILSAYGCPDLASAVIYAGCKPVLIDLAPDKPWMDIDELLKNVSENTIAVISVDLFGISERFDELLNITKQKKIILIQDSAQKFHENIDSFSFYGDVITLSFGRGKPVSILGGGMLLTRSQELLENCQSPEVDSTNTFLELIKGWVRISIYNFMIRPRRYWITEFVPFLHLGETHFYPLPKVSGLSENSKQLLPANISSYFERKAAVEEKLRDQLRALGSNKIIDLYDTCDLGMNGKLSRYPLLIRDGVLRDKLYKELDESGLGVSKMYPATINKIPGLQNNLNKNALFKSAEDFSNEILTLPTHSLVSDNDIQNIINILIKSVSNE
jgi:dTDP-4-amino-4,6-dideoxygalactose transaminase